MNLLIVLAIKFMLLNNCMNGLQLKFHLPVDVTCSGGWALRAGIGIKPSTSKVIPCQ